LEGKRRYNKWNLKADHRTGDSFVAGDVLLEIETDKAQMDVEAQDDGVLAKIVVPDGAQRVNVGKTIAVLAETGDDISTIQIPTEENTSPTERPSQATEASQSQKKSLEKPRRDREKSHLDFGDAYSPAVLRLLAQYDVEDPKVIAATGPQGRLLKGDVLAHVGQISGEVVLGLEKILAKKQHLDLSNITVQTSSKPSESVTLPQPTVPAALASLDTTIRLTEILKLQRRLSG
jgi:pyruvate/2-oxoglutarate dehydrogenase complex dihydrolipoamide acyltransferase (E2) component